MSNTILELKDASIYNGDNLVLAEINLEIKQGEFVYLIGKTGTGKSSFIKTLYADLELKKGQGTIVGFNLKTISDKEIPFLRRKLGVVFQDFKLLNDRSVHNNLEFVLKATGWKENNEIEDKIAFVLNKVDIKTTAQKFPHELSGGEQQRVAIARALLNDPELILADEPTGNLDPQTSIEVMEVFKALNKKGHTILVATHDYAMLLKFPSKTLKCDNQSVYEVVQKTRQ